MDAERTRWLVMSCRTDDDVGPADVDINWRWRSELKSISRARGSRRERVAAGRFPLGAYQTSLIDSSTADPAHARLSLHRPRFTSQGPVPERTRLKHAYNFCAISCTPLCLLHCTKASATMAETQAGGRLQSRLVTAAPGLGPSLKDVVKHARPIRPPTCCSAICCATIRTTRHEPDALGRVAFSQHGSMSEVGYICTTQNETAAGARYRRAAQMKFRRACEKHVLPATVLSTCTTRALCPGIFVASLYLQQDARHKEHGVSAGIRRCFSDLLISCWGEYIP
ncbi:hypothetical protein K461DRAFT_19557 [Myriangium duriaei CBS 260.36]|uniref:Uncharacterized protein n=1 Tax=Myriangium duriaei CBS 260.36 TaxID=1168546 RepID=A0A9P4JD80_9PEZI|nr:hypothetical protein K461DRAFT_19557 [Myriangium duriaei CBS 260.36]